MAIEPSTGEILVKMSSPGYDPQLMVGLDRGKNYSKLLNDPLKPLFDRTTMAQYPPGSIFQNRSGSDWFTNESDFPANTMYV